MSDEIVLTNGTIVTEETVFSGTVVIRGDRTACVDDTRSNLPGIVDLGGDYLLPGLIEIHTDNLEKHVAPRPGVRWPIRAAVLAHDAQVATAGITTVLDALAIAEARDSEVRAEMLADAISAIAAAQAASMLRAEHFLHLRCEVAHSDVVEILEPYLGNPMLRLVSLMDHTPGQRQFASLEKYVEYYKGRFGYSDAEMRDLVDRRLVEQKLHADKHRREIAALCIDRNVPTASHDDATLEHVEEAVGFGMTISEFPTTREAAEAAHRRCMSVVMGAPNVVRGGSHSGNVSASDLARTGLLDILSSDYVPASLLHSAFLLHHQLDLPLAETVAKISANPARALGLDDRGTIEVGKRADLIRVAINDALPVVREVWRAGRRIT